MDKMGVEFYDEEGRPVRVVGADFRGLPAQLPSQAQGFGASQTFQDGV